MFTGMHRPNHYTIAFSTNCGGHFNLLEALSQLLIPSNRAAIFRTHCTQSTAVCRMIITGSVHRGMRRANNGPAIINDIGFWR